MVRDTFYQRPSRDLLVLVLVYGPTECGIHAVVEGVLPAAPFEVEPLCPREFDIAFTDKADELVRDVRVLRFHGCLQVRKQFGHHGVEPLHFWRTSRPRRGRYAGDTRTVHELPRLGFPALGVDPIAPGGPLNFEIQAQLLVGPHDSPFCRSLLVVAYPRT